MPPRAAFRPARAAARLLAAAPAWTLALALLALFLLPRASAAQDRTCDGPPECCPTALTDSLGSRVTVSLGVVVVGLSNVNERAGTWDADYYLYESWPPTPGFTPQTEIVNEVSRGSSQFDTTELRDNRCVRSRRLRSTLHSNYNLHAFPFDHQQLTLVFSDEEYDDHAVRYEVRPYLSGLDEVALGQLAGWQLEGDLAYAQTVRAFRWEPGAPSYDYATFSLPVGRHIAFHLTKFFLPLLVIVAVAFSVFWIDPDDLSSQVGIGVTCLLAAIAFQFAEASNLPEIAYLTLADRVYAVCYIAMALALLASIYTNTLARGGKRELAVVLDRRCRRWFPIALVVMLVGSMVQALLQRG